MIRVGIGGWTYAPWRRTFYPDDLPQSRELYYATRHVTSIEINGTFYRTQTPETFRKWAREAPDGFVFSVKGPRYATSHPKLAEAEPSIKRFFASGVLDLNDKLGPILWQLPPFRRFDAADLEAFLALLPAEIEGRAIRHVLEVRHESFAISALIELLRRHRIALVLTDTEAYPSLADVTGDFVYARLQRASEAEPDGYPAGELDAWLRRFRTWEGGGEPDDVPRLLSARHTQGESRPRDCFVYFIDGAKVRAPAAARALIERLQQ